MHGHVILPNQLCHICNLINDSNNFKFGEDVTLVMSEWDIYGTASASEDDNQIEPEFSDDDEPPDAAPEPEVEDSENESSAGEEGVESDSRWGRTSKAWNNRSTKLDHDWAVTGWALGVMRRRCTRMPERG